ncbi:unnamed protein product, partial [Rotaria sp. Silwood1]
ILFSPTLTKTNSRAILKHIEEIENEIRLIKNLDLNNGDDDDDISLAEGCLSFLCLYERSFSSISSNSSEKRSSMERDDELHE